MAATPFLMHFLAQSAALAPVCLHLLQVNSPLSSSANALAANRESTNVEAIRIRFMGTSSENRTTIPRAVPSRGSHLQDHWHDQRVARSLLDEEPPEIDPDFLLHYAPVRALVLRGR